MQSCFNLKSKHLLKHLGNSFKRRTPSISTSSTTFVASSFISEKKMDYSTTSNLHQKEALDFIDFVNASPSPFHVVHEASHRLEKAGFKKISEKDEWHLQQKGKYYFTRNGSSIVAFVIGGQYQAGKGGFSIVGAHTDSPCLKVKPISKKENVGYIEVGVQLYGGGIW
jgi:aspartyl aminopeptidase